MPEPIAVKLRVLREERGLTHKEAAKLANVSHWTHRGVGRGGGVDSRTIPTVTAISRCPGATLCANFALWAFSEVRPCSPSREEFAHGGEQARKRQYDEHDLVDELFAGRQAAYEVHCPEHWVIP
jgi:hypothetical protein